MARRYSSVGRFRLTVPATPEVPPDPGSLFLPTLLSNQIVVEPNYVRVPFRMAAEETEEPVNVAAMLVTVDDNVTPANLATSGVSTVLVGEDIGEVALPNIQGASPQTYDVLWCAWKD